MTPPEGMRELSDDELSELLSAQPKKSETRYSQHGEDAKTGKPKKVKYSFEDRTYAGWFKLPHTYHECEIQSHDEAHSRGALCTILPDNRHCCRRCYLGRKDSE